MSDADESSTEGSLTDAVETFLHHADDAYTEYERGYTDADATLRRLEGAIASLRAEVEE